jgi:hypothetical protein
MDELNIRIEFGEDRLLGAMKQANRNALGRVGAYVRKAAVNSVRKSKKASAAGTPPNTRRGLLKHAVLFGVEAGAGRVVIGPARSLIGISMTAHEFGGRYRGREYPRRPLMGPALEHAAPRLPKLWEDSLKE